MSPRSARSMMLLCGRVQSFALLGLVLGCSQEFGSEVDATATPGVHEALVYTSEQFDLEPGSASSWEFPLPPDFGTPEDVEVVGSSCTCHDIEVRGSAAGSAGAVVFLMAPVPARGSLQGTVHVRSRRNGRPAYLRFTASLALSIGLSVAPEEVVLPQGATGSELWLDFVIRGGDLTAMIGRPVHASLEVSSGIVVPSTDRRWEEIPDGVHGQLVVSIPSGFAADAPEKIRMSRSGDDEDSVEVTVRRR